jgi:hypothetical protein
VHGSFPFKRARGLIFSATLLQNKVWFSRITGIYNPPHYHDFETETMILPQKKSLKT